MKREWVKSETYAMPILNPRKAVRVNGPPELLEKLADTLEKKRGGVCEHCWQRAVTAHFTQGEPVVDAYERLLRESDCTPEQQAGTDGLTCDACGRKAVHPVTKNCRACGSVDPHLRATA